MHYPQCAGTNARDLNITQRDAQGAVSLYDAPTNVVVSSVGLFARKMSNGDIYRKNTSGAGWTRIGGPGRSFVAVASHLYALNANGTGVFRYSGSGTTWNSIGGAAGLLFNCGNNLCATDPTSGDIFRYDGTSWSFMGGAGRRFVGVNSTVYAQTPNWQALFQWTGSGSSWNWIGGEYLDIIGGAGSVGLFALENGTRNLLRYSGGTFSSVGGPGAQFLGSGELFALTPDRGSVWKYNGSSWFNVGGGASRLYGQNSNVYATAGNFDIWALVPNTSNWNFLGQP
jgi:hypothetical protein